MKKSTRADVRLFVAVAVAGAAALYLLKRNLPSLPSLSDYVPSPETVRGGIGNTIGSFGGYLGSASVGAVEGIGLAVGIPRTNASQCDADKAAGRWWDASFSCAAGDFLSSAGGAVFGSTAVSQAEQASVRRLDNAIDYQNGDPMVSPGGMNYTYF